MGGIIDLKDAYLHIPIAKVTMGSQPFFIRIIFPMQIPTLWSVHFNHVTRTNLDFIIRNKVRNFNQK